MKLYLNSFYDVAFNNSDILKKIKHDLKLLIKDEVELKFLNKFQYSKYKFKSIKD